MTTVRLLPHREASAASVEWGPWWASTGGGPRAQASGVLDGWDYATTLSLQLQPAVHEDEFLDSTGLPNLTFCDVVAMVECAHTGYRLITSHNLHHIVTTDEMVLELLPDPQRLAQSIRLSCHIVLGKDYDGADQNSASRKGARLASGRPVTIGIEGSGARFPTEAVSFRALGYEEGLWSLHYDLTDGDEQFGSAVRLYINSDHPSAGLLLEGGGPEHALVQSALETDTVRQLVAGAASEQHATFSDTNAEWAEGSVGHALQSMSQLFFGRPLEELIRLHEQDRISFERLLQSRTQLFGG